jgi:hypothetical protein
VVTWLLPQQGAVAYSPFMPGDVTTAPPGVHARAVVSLAFPLVEHEAPVLALIIFLAQCSDGSHAPP